jgi:hypothetical protein
MRPRRLELHLGPRLDLRAPGNPTIDPAAKPLVDKLRATQDPKGVFGKLRAVKMRLQFDGVLFDKFTDTPGRYDGHTIEVTNYPKDQTTVWHDFPLPGRALVYSRLPTGQEKLLLVREQAGELHVEAQIVEPLDNLRRQFKKGATKQQLRILDKLGGRDARAAGKELAALNRFAKDVDSSIFGQILGTRFAPKQGKKVYWSVYDVASFFGQALNGYNLGAQAMASGAVERVDLVEKRTRGRGSEKRQALRVEYAEGMRVNPGKGGPMIHFPVEHGDGGLTTGTLHYEVPFMTGKDRSLRAHQTVGDYRPMAGDAVRTSAGWVLYYSARAKGFAGQRCIGTAISENVAGPYEPAATPLICPILGGEDPVVDRPDQTSGVIDPSPFQASDGSRYLLYKTQKTPGTLRMVGLTADGLHVSGPPSRELLRHSDSIENPVMVQRGDHYVLFAAANWYDQCRYSTVWLRSDDKWTWTDKEEHVLLDQASTGICGPGGADLVDGEDIPSRMVLHGWVCGPTDEPCPYEGLVTDPGKRRVMYAAALTWGDDGATPKVSTFLPAAGPPASAR